MDMTEFQGATEIENLLQTLKSLGINRLDTAPRYPPLKPGEAERLLGAAPGLSGTFTIDTKAYADTRTDGSGDLSSEAIQKSISGSLEKLNRPQAVGWSLWTSCSLVVEYCAAWNLTSEMKVSLLYAHRADPSTPIAEQIQSVNDQIAQGRCESVSAYAKTQLGPGLTDLVHSGGYQARPLRCLKIFSSFAMRRAGRNQAPIKGTTTWSPGPWKQSFSHSPRPQHDICRVPVCLSGPISGCVLFTSQLFDFLGRATDGIARGERTLGAGFLTGNLVNNRSEGTGMSEENPLGKAMQRVFAGDEPNRAMKKLVTEVRALGLSSTEVAIRWAVHHSALRDEDSIILGASKSRQIEETVALIRKGPLTPEVIALTDELWALTQLSRGDIL